MKAFSYLRVSSQSDIDKDGFPRQREAVQKYAAANGIEIVDEFRDEGVSGRLELQHRPGLAALLERLESNGVRLVLVEIADRLARDSVVLELTIREFQKLKCQVIAVSGDVDLTAGNDSNPTAKLIRQILAAVAEFDRCIIVLKTRAARDRIRQQTGRCEGRKPYGTRDGEQLTLMSILQLAGEGKQSDEIAKWLNDCGSKTRYGKAWNAGTVWKIVERNKNKTLQREAV